MKPLPWRLAQSRLTATYLLPAVRMVTPLQPRARAAQSHPHLSRNRLLTEEAGALLLKTVRVVVPLTPRAITAQYLLHRRRNPLLASQTILLRIYYWSRIMRPLPRLIGALFQDRMPFSDFHFHLPLS